jgi:RecA-family ATPase
MMSLNFSIAVSNGNKALGTIEILENGAVIYLALEDTARRLQSRLKQMYAHNEKAASNLHLFTSWPRMDQNGLELLEEKIKSIPDTRLVIIDTVAKIRPPRPKNISPYDYDYEVGSRLKAVADNNSVNLLGIAHLRKTESEDRMDDISGTFGITGAADSILVLLRRTGQANAELRLTGRDVESAEYGLKFDSRTLSWNLIGKMDDIKKTAHQQRLYNAIKKYGHPVTPKELVKMTGLKYKFVANTLPKLIKQGKVTKAGYGKYIHLDNITGVSEESKDSGITEESGDS